MDSADFPYFEARLKLKGANMGTRPTVRAWVSSVLMGAVMLLPLCALGQGTIEVDGTVRDKDSNRKIEGVEVQVMRGGSPYDAVSTLSNGKYSLSLDHGSDYVLKFTYRDMSPRIVELNTSTIPTDFHERPFYLTVEMSMFDVPSGFDQGLLDEPIGKVAFDPAKEQLAWDLPYTSRMQSRIEEALAAASGGGDDDGKDEEYAEHMRKAEVEFGRGRWEQSISWADRALSVKPGDAAAEAMIADAQERMANAEAEAEARRAFEVHMREGQIAMRKEDWSAAKTELRAALALFPDEEEPQSLLDEIEAALASTVDDGVDEAYDEAVAEGNAAMQSNDLTTAESAFERASELKPSERLPREKLIEIRQLRKDEERNAAAMDRVREQYDALIRRADGSFDDQDFVKAKSQYEEASALMPDEAYPRDRAVEAEGRIVELGQTESDAPVGSRSDGDSEMDRLYEDRVREGDVAFDAEDWPAAKSAYEAALDIRPAERYPTNRLRRIASMMEEGMEVSGEISIDRDEQRAQAAAEAAESDREAQAIQEEQARLLEEERRAALAEQERRSSDGRSRQESNRERSRSYVEAMQSNDEDDAEAYYRNALEAEIKARGQAVYASADHQAELNEIWNGNSQARRQSTYGSIIESEERRATDGYTAASFREDRMGDLELKVSMHEERAEDWRAQGQAGRRDRLITIRRKDEDNRQSLHDRTKRYAVFVDSLDRMLDTYAEFNRDLRMASIDTRIMRFEDIERTARRHAKVGEGEDIRRMDRLNEVNRQEREDVQAKRLASGEASIRSASALRRVHSKDAGGEPAPEDYREVPAKEDIRQGVEERSYEEGNALIIVRTVRVGNKVDVYRKTVAKHGVYYFKNDRSITRDIWVLETFEIAD